MHTQDLLSSCEFRCKGSSTQQQAALHVGTAPAHGTSAACRVRLDRTPSTLDRAYTIARKVTLLRVALPESYEEKCTQLRARGFAVTGLILVIGAAAITEALLLVHQAGEMLSLLALVLMEASFYWFYYK